MAPHIVPELAQRDMIVTVISTIPNSVPTSAPPPAKPAKKVDIGPIVGGLIGGLAGGLLLAGLVVWLFQSRKKRRKEARAVYERRQRRLAAQRRSKARQSTTPSLASSGARLNGQAYPTSEKTFDPSVPVAAPKRPSKSFASPKQYDPFASEKAYGYEPKPMEYVATGGNYFVQQPYEQPTSNQPYEQPTSNPPTYESDGADAPTTDDSKRNSGSTPVTSKRTSRGTVRAAAADKAALTAGAPAASRHRPSRPSPLARSAEKNPYDGSFEGPSVDFGSPRPGVSPPSSGGSSPTFPFSGGSSPTELYSGESWGIALGGPDETSPASSGHQHSSSGSSDPFAEYHIYERGMGGADEPTIDEPAIDFSRPA